MKEEKEVADGNWDRVLVLIAVVLGGGGGFVGLTADTSDRYHASRAESDFAIRDARTKELESLLHTHLEHSARYTQIIERQQRDIEELQEQIVTHVRKHLEGKR